MREDDDTGGRLVVHPEELRAIGAKLSPVATTISGAHKAAGTRLQVPDGQAQGSAALTAAVVAASRWYTYTQALASRVATTGTDLTAAANAYGHTDDAAAAHQRRVERELERAE
ncbi:type VII secretion target [Longispora sp. K20-0274]|uniref:type VII secretion target n=1 Tax=Longispora sp. K20-0274 TaxID=3088255 RepID=UPI00399A8307